METVTSSPSTVGWPHAPRRRNGWLVLPRLGSGSATDRHLNPRLQARPRRTRLE
jgi:hypothetical protein